MKNLFLALRAGVLGGIVGSLLTAHFAASDAVNARRIEAHELVLLNEQDKAAASLTSVDGRSVLSFLDQSGHHAVDVGFDLHENSRFLVLSGQKGNVTAAITSQSPNGQATIELGEDSWEGKVLLGALQISDDPAVPPNWGLQLSRHDPRSPEFALVDVQEGVRPRTLLSIRRPDGTYWSAPTRR